MILKTAGKTSCLHLDGSNLIFFASLYFKKSSAKKEVLTCVNTSYITTIL
ncbi:hypothetical protein HMPREF1248_0643 [Coriobacteriaceae bacterium BV3Ac1]|nr:hypothetical protein HMPREF1248_0643 [Coriobacteriaceae bacterium BV3Ac1]